MTAMRVADLAPKMAGTCHVGCCLLASKMEHVFRPALWSSLNGVIPHNGISMVISSGAFLTEENNESKNKWGGLIFSFSFRRNEELL